MAEIKKILVNLMEELQDYLIKIDPLKKLCRLPGYGEKHVENLLKKIEKNGGKIFVAEVDDFPVGTIAGIIEAQQKGRSLEYVPTKSARVLELIVSEKMRCNSY